MIYTSDLLIAYSATAMGGTVIGALSGPNGSWIGWYVKSRVQLPNKPTPSGNTRVCRRHQPCWWRFCPLLPFIPFLPLCFLYHTTKCSNWLFSDTYVFTDLIPRCWSLDFDFDQFRSTMALISVELCPSSGLPISGLQQNLLSLPQVRYAIFDRSSILNY